MERKELIENELEDVNGGQITYTWDGKQGSLGVNGNNAYILLDKGAFIDYYNSVRGTMKDSEIIRNLRAKGIIKAP